MRLIWLFCCAAAAWGACTGNSPTWVSTADRTSVAACVSNSSSGDTINVSAGTATYASAVAIPITKNLIIIGAGIGNTVLTCSAGACFAIANGGGGSSASRISGFTLTGYGVDLDRLDATKFFRVDHCRITAASMTDWVIFGYSNVRPRGLIDNNQLVNIRFTNGGTAWGNTDQEPYASYQHAIWASDPDFGGVSTVYFEDNIMTVGHPGASDTNYGGSYVFRFNSVTVDSVYVNEFHGMQGLNRTGQRWEIYGNTYTNPGDNIWAAAFLRGGSGYMFDNVLVGQWGSAASLKVERSCENKPDGVSYCDGTKNVDGNTSGQQGYPCRDQIGRVMDSTAQVGWSLATPWPSQTLRPAMSWNNLAGGTVKHFESYDGCSRESTLHSLANRDWYNHNASFNGTTGIGRGALANRPATCTIGVGYWATDQGEWNSRQAGADGQLYTCTTTDTWSLTYTPYSYPHPLQGETPPPSTPSVSISGARLAGGRVQ